MKGMSDSRGPRPWHERIFSRFSLHLLWLVRERGDSEAKGLLSMDLGFSGGKMPPLPSPLLLRRRGRRLCSLRGSGVQSAKDIRRNLSLTLSSKGGEGNPLQSMQRHLLVPTLALAVALTCACAQAQTIQGRNFQVARYHDAPYELQMRLLLKGALARPQEKDLLLVTGSPVSVQTFTTAGTPELILEAPQCLYNDASRCVNSPGPIHARTADGKFALDGVGFQWQQATNSSLSSEKGRPRLDPGSHFSLFLSNQVRTIMQPPSAGSTDQPARAGVSTAPSGPVQVSSDEFSFHQDSGIATYRKNVRVVATNLTSTSGLLTVHLSPERQLRTLTADEHVVLDYTNTTCIHASGQHAVYTADTGLIRVTGDPSWRAEQQEGGGDDLLLDPTNRILYATGHAWLKMPDRSATTTGILPQFVQTKADPAPKRNGLLEIRSDNYEVRTNTAIFNGNVEVREVEGNELKGRMTCSRMILAFSGTNELQSLVAEGGVVINQPSPEGDRLLSGGRAVYTATNGLLIFTDHPSWQVGSRQGKGNKIVIDARNNQMLVHSNASMRLPASELGQAGLPKSATGSAGGAGKFADIFSDYYSLQETNVVFGGGVYVSHTNMNWAGETVTVNFPPRGGRIDSILAHGGVAFDLLTEKGQRVHGTGDYAVYTWSITQGLTNELVKLVGTPAALRTTNGLVTDRTLILDLKEDKLIAEGDYEVRVALPNVDTNKLNLPGGRSFK
jgi:lipopolysaccharide export system protein LptA